MNIVTLLGRIGRDPEISYSGSGMAITRFSLATNRRKKEDGPDWHRCVSFGKTAEVIEKYVRKGDQLGVVGEVQYGSYEKDGATVYTTDIIVNQIDFVSNKQTDPGQSAADNVNNTFKGSQRVPDPVPDDGSIPF